MPGLEEKTMLYLQTQKSIRDFADKMQSLLFRWYSLSYGGELLIEMPNGQKINYVGITYKGSPRAVFWGRWSEVFFEEAIPEILSNTGQMAVDAQINVDKAMDETAELLRNLILKFYSDFSSTDQKLMGNGIKFGERREPAHKVCSLVEFVNQLSEFNKRKYGIAKNEGERKEIADIVEVKWGIGPVKIDFRALYRQIRGRMKRKIGS
jgi:hypothetical protein